MAVSRRELLWGSAVVAAAGALNLVRVPNARAGELEPLQQLRLVPGMRLGPCTLARVRRVRNGKLQVVLRDPAGRELVVEVHRHDDRAPGIARAGSLAVYLVNGGSGATPTDETHGLGAMALARVLEARERAGARIPGLASIVERWKHDPPRRG